MHAICPSLHASLSEDDREIARDSVRLLAEPYPHPMSDVRLAKKGSPWVCADGCRLHFLCVNTRTRGLLFLGEDTHDLGLFFKTNLLPCQVMSLRSSSLLRNWRNITLWI